MTCESSASAREGGTWANDACNACKSVRRTLMGHGCFYVEMLKAIVGLSTGEF